MPTEPFLFDSSCILVRFENYSNWIYIYFPLFWFNWCACAICLEKSFFLSFFRSFSCSSKCVLKRAQISVKKISSIRKQCVLQVGKHNKYHKPYDKNKLLSDDFPLSRFSSHHTSHTLRIKRRVKLVQIVTLACSMCWLIVFMCIFHIYKSKCEWASERMMVYV